MAAQLDISHVELLAREKGRTKIDTVFLERVAELTGETPQRLAARILTDTKRRRKAA